MNDFQIAYTVALALLAVASWRAQRYAALCLVGNLVATLAICLAMDLGAMDRMDATRSMMLADLATGVALALRPGLPRVISAGYAITVPIYTANLIWAVPIDATFGYIYAVAVAQLVVLAIGNLGHHGGGGLRFASRAVSLASPRRNTGVSQGPISGYHAQNRVRE